MIHLILVLAVLGCILYLIQTYIPMAAPFKTIIAILILLNFAGIGHFNLGGL